MIDLDVDNIVKPIQDSLEGLIYINDSQVVEVRSLKRNLSGSFNIQDVTPILANALTSGREFVFLRIDTAEDLGELGV